MPLSRRRFLGSSMALLGSALLGPIHAARGQAAMSVLSDPLLDFAAEERARLAELMRRGLLEIAPVLSVPKDDPTPHLGWPVATALPGGRVVVAYTRKNGHKGPEDLPNAGRHILFGDDLQRWRPAQPSRIGPHEGMHCIGHVTRRDGGERLVVLASDKPRRVYLSDDGGVTWRGVEDAFGNALDDAAHVGPNLITHPMFGPVAVFGQQTDTSHGGRNFITHSLDGGETWRVHEWMNQAAARSVEPALATWGPGHMVLIGREWVDSFALGPDGFYGHTQHVYRCRKGDRFEEIRFDTARTNIVGNPAAGLGCHDTAEVIFNPVTGRIEALQSHRWGGGPGRTGTTRAEHEHDEISSLNLWSIDPDALLAGSADWRFDGTIIERIGYSRKGNKDGLHPGGSVIDLDRNMQHIFVYAGWRRAPSNLYRISRSLDTPKWRHAQSM